MVPGLPSLTMCVSSSKNFLNHCTQNIFICGYLPQLWSPTTTPQCQEVPHKVIVKLEALKDRHRYISNCYSF
jgi:hypothetical protein